MAEAAELESGSIQETSELLQRWCLRPGRGMVRAGWDSAIARERVVEKLKDGLAAAGVSFYEIELPAGTDSVKVAHKLIEELQTAAGGVVSITGVEWAYPEGGSLIETLGALSFYREELARLPYKMIWWMPEHIIDKFVLAVPDFESWFRLRLHLSEVPAFESGQLGMERVGQSLISTAEASHLADQLVERIRTAESRGISPNRVWRELGPPLMKVLVQGGLNMGQWLSRSAGVLSQVESHLQNLETTKGPENPETLDTLEFLAILAQEQNDLVKARKIGEQVLQARRRLFGKDAPETLRATQRLTLTLFKQGALKAAELLVRGVLEGRSPGTEGDLTWWFENTLAAILKAKGDLGEARRIQEEVVDRAKRVYGENHLYTLTAATNLAAVLADQGDWAQAERRLREIVDIQALKLGPDHPNTLDTMQNLATVLHLQGRLEEARVLQERVLIRTSKLLGPKHPLTVRRSVELLTTLIALRAFEDARALFHRDLEWLLTENQESRSSIESDSRATLERLLPKLNLP